MLSSQYGDGDGLELSTYQYLADLLPVRIPRFYFGDLHRGSTNCILALTPTPTTTTTLTLTPTPTTTPTLTLILTRTLALTGGSASCAC